MPRALILGGLLACVAGASAIAAPSHGAACLDLRATQGRVTLSGKLTLQLFVQALDGELADQAAGDETVLILQLARPVCATDGMFLDRATRLDTVQVKSDRAPVMRELAAAVGRSVTVEGEAFGAFSARHKAPLVLEVDRIAVR